MNGVPAASLLSDANVGKQMESERITKQMPPPPPPNKMPPPQNLPLKKALKTAKNTSDQTRGNADSLESTVKIMSSSRSWTRSRFPWPRTNSLKSYIGTRADLQLCLKIQIQLKSEASHDPSTQ